MKIFSYGRWGDKKLPHPISDRLGISIYNDEELHFRTKKHRNDNDYQYGKITTDIAMKLFNYSDRGVSFKMSNSTYLCAARFILREDCMPVFINLGGTVYCNHELINRSEKILQKKLNAIPVSNIHDLFYAKVKLPVFKYIKEKKQWLEEMSENYNKTYSLNG